MKFYYKRDKKRRPIVTVCEIKGPEGVGVGYAKCCNLDFPDKAMCKLIASGRAMKALAVKVNGLFPDGSPKFEYRIGSDLYDYFESFAPSAVSV